MEPHRLPIGIHTFREIRENGMYYVDKTQYAKRISRIGKHYFLSRPRRFGKSLFLSMLQDLFEGKEELFAGLDIHDQWDWSAHHPVIRLDFSGGGVSNPKRLEKNVNTQLKRIEKNAGVPPGDPDGLTRFYELIGNLRDKFGQPVVILVDEYDAPINEALDDPGAVRANQEYLRDLYGILKQREADIRLSFLTGITRFSRLSLFSKLNNVLDISLDPVYSSICGYTDSDIDSVFHSEIADLDRNKIRHWYNGYSWLGKERVYNPFDILLLFMHRKFRPWWFKTGTPSFLIGKMKDEEVFSINYEYTVDAEELESSFDIDEVDARALLFQTGYLTIAEETEEDDDVQYKLCYPNREVSTSLNILYLRSILPKLRRNHKRQTKAIRRYLRAYNFDKLESYLQSVFAGIPFQWHTRIDVARHEAYVASLFYSLFKGANLDVRVEESTNRGRIDMAVVDNKGVFLFEFKVVARKPAGKALKQLREKKYADKFRHLGLPIHLIGVEFSNKERNIVAFDVEQA